MKKILTLLVCLISISSFSQIFMVKFKDGRESYGHLYTDKNIDNFEYGNPENSATLKFREVETSEYKDIPSRSIGYFLYLRENEPTVKYYALPVRTLNRKTNKISDKESMLFLNLIVDGPLQVYGSVHLDYLPYKKDTYKTQHSFIGMGYYFFKTDKTDYVVSTKPTSYGGIWPGYSTISAFLSDCPEAKKAFDAKYPGTTKDKRAYEKRSQKMAKEFEKEFMIQNKKMKKTERDLKLLNEKNHMYANAHLEFYQDIVDIYTQNCVK